MQTNRAGRSASPNLPSANGERKPSRKPRRVSDRSLYVGNLLPRAIAQHYPHVLGELIRRLINLAVLALATLAFFLVPVGSQTLYEHLRAVFSTHEAATLCRDLTNTALLVEETLERDLGFRE